MSALDRIDAAVKIIPIIIFMKGTPNMPQCGFSSRAAQALMACGEQFAYVNVLTDPEIFQDFAEIRRFTDVSASLYQWRINWRL